MSRSPSAALDAWLASHHGVVSQSIIERIGVPASSVRSRMQRGSFIPIFPGVWRSAQHPSSRLATMTAICLRNDNASIAFTTAGEMSGLRRMRIDRNIHVLVPHGVSPELPGVVVHRCRQIDAIDLGRRRSDGIRLTSVPRTILDACSLIGVRRTESVIEQVLADRMCSFDDLLETAHRLYHPRRPGSTTFREVLLRRPQWRGAARSDLEKRMFDAIARAGLPMPAVNHPVALTSEHRVVFDLCWADFGLALEVDHPFWHDGSEEVRKDKRRDRKAAIDGWLTVRVTEADIDFSLAESVADLGGVLRSRGWLGVAA